MPISDNHKTLELHRDAIRFGDRATKRFWQRVFTKHVFKGHEWEVSSQQPPVPSSQKRIDFLVEGWESVFEDARSYLLVFTAKPGCVTPGYVQQREIEIQALRACVEHSHHTNRTRLWAMTCFGPHARIWAFSSHPRPGINMFYPRISDIREAWGDYRLQGPSLASRYLDICENEEGFRGAFNYIMNNPSPSRDLIDSLRNNLASRPTPQQLLQHFSASAASAASA